MNKIAAIQDWLELKNDKKLLRFCFMLLFLQALISDRADLTSIMKKMILEKMTVYTANDRKWIVRSVIKFYWDSKQQAVFKIVKKNIVHRSLSEDDEKLQYHLVTDVSKIELEEVLFQLQTTASDTKWNSHFHDNVQVIMFLSFQCLLIEQWYHITKREILTIFWCLKEIRWLIVKHLYSMLLYIDHRALCSVLISDAANDRIAKW